MACISLVAAVASPSPSTRLSFTALPKFAVQSLGCRSRNSRRSITMRAVPSNESATLEQCQAVIAEQLGIDASLVKPDSKFSDLGADSLDTVEIVMQLEEKFKIQVEQEGAEKIVTVKDASDVIHRLVSQKQNN